MVGQEIFLIIENGKPFEIGQKLQLLSDNTLLGRSFNTHQPDIAFTSLLVSRSHAIMSFSNNQVLITDLSSKHGTKVNNLDIGGNKACALKHGDRISLAKDTVILMFNNENEGDPGETVNFTGGLEITAQFNKSGLVINPDRREVLLDGIPVYLFGKDVELLMLLYTNQSKAVSYQEIKVNVWPERILTESDGIPDVGSDEISALMYRLRKRLGKYGQQIISIPRYGYMLDLEHKES